MTLNHVHVGVRDLSGALEWVQRIWQVGPAFQNERMATLQFGAFILILDAATEDSPATLGFQSDDCDRDYQGVIARGAESVAAPMNQPWGTRAAYLRGPGRLKFEIEGPLI
jgi:hypothetical protein